MFVYERSCVHSVFRGSIKSISMSLEAYSAVGSFWQRPEGGLGTKGGEGVKMRGGVNNAAGPADE